MKESFDDLRAVFLPRSFREKYRYLGSVPYPDDGIYGKLKPLVLAMDNKAKPWWCPRWVLRFLHLYGSDNSVVRVRNWRLHNLSKRLTKGILLVDYKIKWSDYDLRISIYGDQDLQWLADAIELKYYRDGRKVDLINQINRIDPDSDTKYMDLCELEAVLETLQKKTK